MSDIAEIVWTRQLRNACSQFVLDSREVQLSRNEDKCEWCSERVTIITWLFIDRCWSRRIQIRWSLRYPNKEVWTLSIYFTSNTS